MSSSESDESDASSDFEDLDSIEIEEEMVHEQVEVEQWVQVIDACSVRSKFEQSVAKGVGVGKLCGATAAGFGQSDNTNVGWMLPNDKRQETLVVSFATPVFINEIDVYESLNPGSIIKLEMQEPSRNRWWPMWQRRAIAEKSTSPQNIFKPLLRRYHIQSNTIRITFDSHRAEQVGIQAIKLLGTSVFDVTLHQKTLVQSMAELYEQAHKKIHTDAQFSVKDKVFHAHRNILCARSQYFRSLLINDFLEKSQTKPIELTDVNADTFREILYFIYTGAYHSSISYDVAVEAMVYSNKINLTSATRAAMEHIAFHLRSNHDLILTVYSFVKKRSPAFDALLECIYVLCAENLNAVCKQKEFGELSKELMVDIICNATERRASKAAEPSTQEGNLAHSLFD